MAHHLEINTLLSAGKLCLFVSLGIFSGLSNDGKQSPALFMLILGMRPEARIQDKSVPSIPDSPIRQGTDFPYNAILSFS
jgi:hypothetical protein